MNDELDFGDPIHNSRPPLRWIANLSGSIASGAILKIAFIEEDVMEEKATFGFKYKFYGWLWDTFWPLYNKYGTVYEWNPHSEKTGMVDPEYFHWDYIDEETGDAFKIINFGGKE